jgi:hypothetical protein
VPDDQIEPMLKDALGPLWKEAKVVARIRRRLWRHLNVFEENVRRMNDAMEEMKEKLGIGPDGKVGGSFPQNWNRGKLTMNRFAGSKPRA